jgi:bifunctional UDP-N-acetylglucosamine pyrophosphorylase/glucosamine-1-phosphate N-acetyltransferase
MPSARVAAVIMAAGKGTRLKSELPKVLHEVCGRPMLAHVIDACRAAGVADCVLVVGHGKDRVIETFADDAAGLTWVEQSPQLGTGHAVMVCREAIAQFDRVLILCGDGPLLREETIQALLDRHAAEGNSATLATAMLDDPTGYGRIWRDAGGNFRGIVEHADCTPEQREIREVNPSYYCFTVADLLPTLDQLSNDNAKGEYYLTDVFALLMQAGKRVGAITSVAPEDIYSINSRQDLARVNGVMRDRVLERLMSNGVTVVDPATTWIDGRATFGRDTVILPGVHIQGAVQVGANCRIGPLVRLAAPCAIADDTEVTGPAGGAA